MRLVKQNILAALLLLLSVGFMCSADVQSQILEPYQISNGTVNGVPYVGTLTAGQTWCLNAGPPATMIPCAAGLANPTIDIVAANAGFAGNPDTWYCDTGTVHTWDLTSTLPPQTLYLREITVGNGVDLHGIERSSWSLQTAAGTTIGSGGEDHYGDRAGGMEAGRMKESYYSYITIPPAASNRLVFNAACTVQVTGNNPQMLIAISLKFN